MPNDATGHTVLSGSIADALRTVVAQGWSLTVFMAEPEGLHPVTAVGVDAEALLREFSEELATRG
jgi:hypothetical protein